MEHRTLSEYARRITEPSGVGDPATEAEASTRDSKDGEAYLDRFSFEMEMPVIHTPLGLNIWDLLLLFLTIRVGLLPFPFGCSLRYHTQPATVRSSPCPFPRYGKEMDPSCAQEFRGRDSILADSKSAVSTDQFTELGARVQF